MSANERRNWTKASPAADGVIADLVRNAPYPLPDALVRFLRDSNGGEGHLGVRPGWFVMWPAEEIMDRNRRYEVPEQLSGYFAFGSSGGGELLAFDTRHGEPFPVVSIPFIPMDAEEAVRVAGNFEGFMALMGMEWSESDE